MFPFLLGKDLEVGFPDHVATLLLPYQKLPNSFPKWPYYFAAIRWFLGVSSHSWIPCSYTNYFFFFFCHKTLLSTVQSKDSSSVIYSSGEHCNHITSILEGDFTVSCQDMHLDGRSLQMSVTSVPCFLFRPVFPPQLCPFRFLWPLPVRP